MKVKVGLIDNWRQWWKIHSLYVFAFIGALPDVWNLITASGLLHLMPIGADLDATIKVMALIGAIVRMMKIRIETAAKNAGDSDQAA